MVQCSGGRFSQHVCAHGAVVLDVIGQIAKQTAAIRREQRYRLIVLQRIIAITPSQKIAVTNRKRHILMLHALPEFIEPAIEIADYLSPIVAVSPLSRRRD